MPVQADGNWVFNLNFECSSSLSENFRAIGDCAEVAGWNIAHSSNGTTVVTGSRLSDAGWDASTSSWEEWHDPGGHRALIIQRRSTASQANIWLTQTGTLPLIGASAGGPTTPPSAGSFQASLLASSLWGTTTVASNRAHIAFGSAPVPGTNVYPFYIVGVQKGSTSSPNFFALLGTETPEPALDREPWVWLDSATDSSLSGWYRAGNVGGAQTFVTNGLNLDNVSIPYYVGQSPYSGDRYLIPAFAYDSSPVAQVKGRVYDYYETNLTTTGDTVGLTVSGSCWHHIAGGVVFRWQPGLIPDWS